MSNRTIIEINHDLLDAIRRMPTAFADRLCLALRSNSDSAWDDLSPWGITRIVEAHHSESRKVVVEGREYPIG